MKPEPLKNKTHYHNVKNAEGKTNQKYPYHYDSDIKSAVEWLEKKIGESNNSDTICMSKGELYEWIEETFEDVTKWK